MNRLIKISFQLISPRNKIEVTSQIIPKWNLQSNYQIFYIWQFEPFFECIGAHNRFQSYPALQSCLVIAWSIMEMTVL